MLKNIPEIISPELMKILMEMGHGDEICFGDANFPAQSVGEASRVVRCDGHTITELLEAILKLFPLDSYVERPAALMQKVRAEEPTPKVWDTYKKIIEKNDFSHAFGGFEMIERFAFYERAKKCYAVVATTEYEGYANLILKKGVIFK